MRNIAKDKLMKTADGRAIIELIELAGGRSAFMRITGFSSRQLDNWYRRSLISQQGAIAIAANPFFAARGVTRETVRPSLTEHQWRVMA